MKIASQLPKERDIHQLFDNIIEIEYQGILGLAMRVEVLLETGDVKAFDLNHGNGFWYTAQRG